MPLRHRIPQCGTEKAAQIAAGAERQEIAGQMVDCPLRIRPLPGQWHQRQTSLPSAKASASSTSTPQVAP